MENVAQVMLGAAMMGLAITQANDYRAGTSQRWNLITVPTLGFLSAWVAFNAALGLMPVLVDMEPKRIVMHEGGRIDLLMHGKKIRACNWLRTDGYVQDATGRLHEAAVEYPDDVSPGNTRPVGTQSFGVWSMQAPTGVQPVGVQFIVRHSCGWMWETTTTVIGPFSVHQSLPQRR